MRRIAGAAKYALMLGRITISLLPFLLLGCGPCEEEDHYEGWEITWLSGKDSESDYVEDSSGEVTIHIGDVAYTFYEAIAVATGDQPSDEAFHVEVARVPRSSSVNSYEHCQFTLTESPVSEIDFESALEPFRFMISVTGEETRRLCQEALDAEAAEPDTNIDETWDDWLELVEFSDVAVQLEAEQYSYTETRSCD
jgi:hypothetical protein